MEETISLQQRIHTSKRCAKFIPEIDNVQAKDLVVMIIGQSGLKEISILQFHPAFCNIFFIRLACPLVHQLGKINSINRAARTKFSNHPDSNSRTVADL